MADLSGKSSTQFVKDLQDWAAERRQFYIKAFSQGGTPYGTTKLSVDEQVSRFIQATQNDYAGIIESLNQRYMGLPDAQNRVNQDLANYIRRMLTLMLSRRMISDQQFSQQQQQITQQYDQIPEGQLNG